MTILLLIKNQLNLIQTVTNHQTVYKILVSVLQIS